MSRPDPRLVAVLLANNPYIAKLAKEWDMPNLAAMLAARELNEQSKVTA